MTSSYLKYVPMHLVRTLMGASIVCGIAGLLAIAYAAMDAEARVKNSAGAGVLLIGLSVCGSILAFKKSLYLEVKTKEILMEKRFFFYRRSISIPYTKIQSVTWKFFSGSIALTTKDGEITIPGEIHRIEGDLVDNAVDPECPGGGSTRETYNLSKELRSRIATARES